MKDLLMRYVRCLDKLDMTDKIIKICVNLSNLCHLCAIKHNAKLSFNGEKGMRITDIYVSLYPNS